MSVKIIEIIENLPDLLSLKPARDKDIKAAELKLNLKFAEDYIAYIKKFGAISFKGSELTGVVDAPRLNVVNATLKERELNKSLSLNKELYVIESLGIEGVLILQNAKGEIFELKVNGEPEKIFDNLGEYLCRRKD